MADPTPDNAVSEDTSADTIKETTYATDSEATASEALSGDETATPPDMVGDKAETTPNSHDLAHLPVHTRSLLRIRVPVTVTLATQRKPVREITELGPGSLVKFEKTFDEPLELTVGDLPIACGEAVKVGDKFGLRISNLIKPHERFASVAQPSAT